MSSEVRANYGELSNKQLATRIKAREDISGNMEQLYNQMRRFIHAVAWKYWDSGELEDQGQEGYLALYPAIDGYDPAQGVKSLTYVKYHIRQRMHLCPQTNGSCSRFPVHCLERMQQYKCLCNAFNREYDREPPDREVTAFMGLTLEQMEGIKESVCMARPGNLGNSVKGFDSEEDTTIGDMVASVEDTEEDTVERMQQEQLEAELQDYMDDLPGQQPAVIGTYSQGGVAMEAVGREYDTSGETVRHIQAKALREPHKPRYSKRLRPFLPGVDRVYSMVMTGNGVGRFNRTWTSSTEHAALNVIDWEERHRMHLELLEKVQKETAKSRRAEA